MINLTKAQYRRRLSISALIGLTFGLVFVFLAYLFFIPEINFSKQKKSGFLSKYNIIPSANAQDDEDPGVQIGEMVAWEGKAKSWVKRTQNKIKKKNGNILRGDNKLLKWDRSAVGWIVDANLIRDLVNHRLKDSYVIDFLTLEIGDKDIADVPFTLVLSGLSKTDVNGSQREKVDNPLLYGGLENIYRIINFYPDSIPNNEAKASIEYVGPCNTCP